MIALDPYTVQSSDDMLVVHYPKSDTFLVTYEVELLFIYNESKRNHNSKQICCKKNPLTQISYIMYII